jgi:hypothetical protein
MMTAEVQPPFSHKWGYAVKFVAVTNGDAGHQLTGGAVWQNEDLLKHRKQAKDWV